MTIRVIGLVCALLLCACNGTSTVATVPVASATPGGVTLYAYSPDDAPSVVTYPAWKGGRLSPSSILSGSKTKFVGGKSNVFGGAISVAADGTLYVLDAMRAKVFTFAPGAKGNTAPTRVESLPQDKGARFGAPQYGGFALDSNGNFWTANRFSGELERFPLAAAGWVKPSVSLVPQVQEGPKLTAGVASTVASDGRGNIYCVCQPRALFLQLYCITEYNVASATPKLVRSFYGILGSLDTQIPSNVLHVDANTKRVYEAIWTPAAVVEYPADAPSGPAPAPRVIGGPATTLNAVPAAITTDSHGDVYVAQGSTILVFAANASGNVAPKRIISDAQYLHFLGSAYGDLLNIQ
jgi:hypothetical protein